MWRRFCFIVGGLFLYSFAFCQTVVLSPCQSPSPDLQVTLTFDATGTPLEGESKVYAHAGIVTNNTNAPTGADWKFVVGTWGTDNGVGGMTAVSGQPNKWQLTLGPTLRQYFNPTPANSDIYYIAVVFRNAAGSKQTSPDIFIKLNQPLSILAPEATQLFLDAGEEITLSGQSCSTASSLAISVDSGSGFTQVAQTTNATNLSFSYLPTQAGSITVKVTAVVAGVTFTTEKDLDLFVKPTTVIAPLPAGLKRGINYHADQTKATLVLETPVTKEFVYVAGDFNNWSSDPDYFMKKTPDGKFFWLQLTGLTPAQEYAFQYWIDGGSIKIGDPYSDKIVDPWNDQYIPETTYPNLITYRRTENGMASVLQTGQTSYSWAATENTWVRPKKENLIVYELLLRDFIGSKRYRDLADSLSYFKRLGINAIQLMPIMEFEGNESWGYNPAYFLAPDKYYGTREDLKYLVETAHKEGIAIILDIALNHAFGQNPFVKMYWDNGQIAANSPYFNQVAKHPFNVGYDFNHESIYTKSFVDSVTSYWVSEYHVDGFRFDLSKGFTQVNSGSDVGAWSNYDASRIALLDRMAKKLWETDEDTYVILEHFAASSEETELASKGMLLWRNMNGLYKSLLSGNASQTVADANAKGWVSYMESHDEERVTYDMLNFGTSTAGYNIKSLPVALDRLALGSVFHFLIPGPKMLWQFQELGYDKSINLCVNGTVNNCRLDPKPLVWAGGLNYYGDEDRQTVFKSLGAALKFRNTNLPLFESGSFTITSSSTLKQIRGVHESISMLVLGNFGTTTATGTFDMLKSGPWYEYFSGNEVNFDKAITQITLAPGDFYILTSVPQEIPDPALVTAVEPVNRSQAGVYPNPIKSGSQLYLSGVKGIQSVQLVKQTGQEVQAWKNISEDYINLNNHTSGLYILRIYTKSGIQVRKVVID